MLIEQTLEQLTALQLHGMVGALRQWQAHPPPQPLARTDLVGLLADAEWVARENRKLTARLKAAKLKLPACVEDVDYQRWSDLGLHDGRNPQSQGTSASGGGERTPCARPRATARAAVACSRRPRS